MAKWIIGSNEFYLHCSNCGTVSEKATNFCSYCGEKIEKDETIGTCEFCEYMHEIILRYDDEKILRPECWGCKNPTRVVYNHSCKDFKKREG